jgi:hypothetical protein
MSAAIHGEAMSGKNGQHPFNLNTGDEAVSK